MLYTYEYKVLYNIVNIMLYIRVYTTSKHAIYHVTCLHVQTDGGSGEEAQIKIDSI